MASTVGVKTAVVYKTVISIHDRLYSAGACPPWLLGYKPGEWARPAVAPSRLFAFDTLENARVFLQNLPPGPYQIWECEAEEATPYAGTLLVAADGWGAFWHGDRAGAVVRAPEGTVLCTGIRLIERVS